MQGIKPEYIEDDAVLSRIVEEAKQSRILAIDTEFIREKTYYPNLCLIQMAYEIPSSGGAEESSRAKEGIPEDDTLRICIIDPFKVSDLSVLSALLEDEAIVKIFHAGFQDIEILFHETGSFPSPIFDVQIAASLLGQTQQAGLGSLVSTFLGVSIKKGDSFTDWSRRPLALSQIEYAAEDVVYLPELYSVMTSRLEHLGRLSWLDDEFGSLSDRSRYSEDPMLRYRRLKKGNQLTRKQMAAARDVAAWREIEAQSRDIPRKWILTDEQIVESCKREPKTIDELFLIRGIKNSLSTKEARIILKLMLDAFDSDPETWPEHDVQPSSERNVDAAVDLMMALVRLRSKEEGIAMQTLASHNELVDVARGHLEGSPLLSGWRRKIVGEELLELLEGRLALSIDDCELVAKKTV